MLAAAVRIIPALAIALPTTVSGPNLGLPAVPAPDAQQVTAQAAMVRQACVAQLPLDVRIGQTMLVITGNPGEARKRLQQGLIAGMLGTGILSTGAAKQFRTATSGTKYGALLGADEEGGLVQRYRRVAGAMPSAAAQARTMTPEQVRALYREHAKKLRKWGVNLVFAPVADVGSGPGIGTRSYSSNPKVVAQYATAAAAGISDAGLLPTAKHFPGHGRASADTHSGRSVGPGIDSLRKVDLVPFESLVAAGDSAVMVGHTQIPGYSDKPSTQSARVISTLLRGELGYSGLVISDALGMAAATGRSSQGAALVKFLRAGGDLGIVGYGGSVEGRRAVRAALKSGKLTQARIDQAAARVFAAKGVDPCGLAGGSAPKPEDDGAAPSDAPITNPTKDS